MKKTTRQKFERCDSHAPYPAGHVRCCRPKFHRGGHYNRQKDVTWAENLLKLAEPEQATEQEAHHAVRTLLSYMGEDPTREGLHDTPRRVVKAWDEMVSGYREDPAEILQRDFHGEGYDQMIVCRRVQVISVCEHHLLPFLGQAWVAYIPRRRVVGLSKMARLVQCFMRRLQIQEKLTKQVADAMMQHLDPLGVGVRIVAVHSCMSCRGAMEPNSDMVTTALHGNFRNQSVRAEFLSQCQ
jgi:GTP cyclohydrolase I